MPRGARAHGGGAWWWWLAAKAGTVAATAIRRSDEVIKALLSAHRALYRSSADKYQSRHNTGIRWQILNQSCRI